jgi:hypothetical protein
MGAVLSMDSIQLIEQHQTVPKPNKIPRIFLLLSLFFDIE